MITFESVTIDPTTLGESTDLRDLFDNDRPVELEIGSGKGTFILRQAKAHPARNFVGIEWANQFYKYAADRMVRWGLTNVRMMRTDASHFVLHRLAPDCIDALHVYHPDPWPKKRHHKRRLFQPAFVEAAIKALRSGARFAIQTDHADYFEQIKEVTTCRPELEPIPFVDEEHGTIGQTVKTNFEIKYEKEGRTFHQLAFRRR